MIDTTQLNQLDAPQLREVVRSLMGTVVAKDREIAFKQATIDKLTHEMAVLKRLKFAARAKPSTPSRRACSKRRSTPTWQRCRPSSTSPPDDRARQKKQPKRAAAAGASAAARSAP